MKAEQEKNYCHHPVAIRAQIPKHPTSQSCGNANQSNREQDANSKQVGDQKRPTGAHPTLPLNETNDQWDAREVAWREDDA
jgi:hypothetical protein